MIPPRLLSLMVTSCALLFVSGCVEPAITDKDASPNVALRIDVPESARPLGGYVDPYRVEFLMPNDKWREYVAKYSLSPLEQSPYISQSVVPVWCVPAARAGVQLTRWVAGGDIQYFDTGMHAYRSVSVTPDCEPGNAYVIWVLGKPK